MSNILISTNETSKSEIIIENGISKNIKDFFENKNYFLITNTTLAKLYPEFVYNPGTLLFFSIYQTLNRSEVFAYLSINCKTKSSNSAVAEQSSRSTCNMSMCRKFSNRLSFFSLE